MGWQDAPVVEEPKPSGNKWESAPVVEPSKQGGFMEGVNVGIMSEPGAEAYYGAMGVDEPNLEGGTIPFEAGRVVGTGLSFALPIGGAGIKAAQWSGKLPGVSSAAGRALHEAKGISRGILEDIGLFTAKKPVATLAGETTAAASAGAAGEVVEREYPGNRAAGEVVGGFGPAGVVAGVSKLPQQAARATGFLGEKMPLLGPSFKRFVSDPVRAATTSGARRRVEQRIQSTVHEKEKALEALRDYDILAEAKLSPAKISDDPGLMALERSVMKSSHELERIEAEDIKRANDAIYRAAVETGTGEKGIASREYMEDLLDTRLSIADQKARERIGKLGESPSSEQVNRIQREELDKAMRDATEQERQLWGMVPQDVQRGTQNARMSLGRFVRDTPMAQQDDIPSNARSMLDPDSDSYLGNKTTVKELVGLRSKLLEQARNARAAGQYNQARMADEIADAILTDLGGQSGDVRGEAGQALRTALDYTRTKRQLFAQNRVGRVMKPDRSGVDRIPEGLTLEAMIGGGGPRAREGADELMRIAQQYGDVSVTRQNIADYLRRSYHDTAVRNGAVTKTGAQSFFKKYDQILTRFPELRKDLMETTAYGIVVPPKKEIAAVMNSPNSGRLMEEMVNSARQDGSIITEQNLKTAFIDHMMKESVTQTRDEARRPILSGSKWLEMMNSSRGKAALEKLFTKDELSRMRRIGNTAARLERYVHTEGFQEGPIPVLPNAMMELIARIGGAQVGRVVAGRTGGGTVQTPGIFSNKTRELLQKSVKDPAYRLLIDSIGNKELFEAMLTSNTKILRDPKAKRVLNAWAADVIKQYGEDEDMRESNGR